MKLFIDTSAGSQSCGTAIFTIDGGVQRQTGDGHFTAEGKKPGLSRCRYETTFFSVPQGGHLVCGSQFCTNAHVTAGQTTLVRFD